MGRRDLKNLNGVAVAALVKRRAAALGGFDSFRRLVRE